MFIKRHLEYSLLGGDPNIRIDRFPDGQQNVTILNVGIAKKCSSVVVSTRLNNFMDLELLLCFIASFRTVCEDESAHLEVHVPYLLGARSDRIFEPGGNDYLYMLLNILGDQAIQEIYVLDLHNPSAVMLENLNSLTLEDLLRTHPTAKTEVSNLLGVYNELTILAPDKGAIDRAKSFRDGLDLPSYLLPLSKERTDKGITITGAGNMGRWDSEDVILIVDDICDGGGTFIATAEYLRRVGYKGHIGLWVTHGIFSKGFTELKKHLEFIITTNSYADFGGIEQGSVKDKDLKGFLHQINVF